jgi:hypothetical protein
MTQIVSHIKPDKGNGKDDGAGPSSSTPKLTDVMASLQAITGSQERILKKLKKHGVVLGKLAKRLRSIEEWVYDTSDSIPPVDGQADPNDGVEVEGEGEDDDDDNCEDASDGFTKSQDHST